MTNEAQTIIGIIDEVKSADGESERGEWRRYDFRIRSPSGTKRYSTFDKGWPTNLKTGKTYRFTYTSKQSGEFTNLTLTGAIQVDESEFGAQPASNGQEPPPEPATDEAQATSATGAPQPELKSPSRSYDQNQDITRRSIERQIALKAAVELFSEAESGIIVSVVVNAADRLFAWLRETASDVRSSPEEPISEPAGTVDEQIEIDKHRREMQASSDRSESDGGPALFLKQRNLANAGAFRQVLADDFGLKNMPEIEAALKAANLNPFAQVGNFVDAIEALYYHRQAEPVGSGPSQDMESEAGRSPSEQGETPL